MEDRRGDRSWFKRALDSLRNWRKNEPVRSHFDTLPNTPVPRRHRLRGRLTPAQRVKRNTQRRQQRVARRHNRHQTRSQNGRFR